MSRSTMVRVGALWGVLALVAGACSEDSSSGGAGMPGSFAGGAAGVAGAAVPPAAGASPQAGVGGVSVPPAAGMAPVAGVAGMEPAAGMAPVAGAAGMAPTAGMGGMAGMAGAMPPAGTGGMEPATGGTGGAAPNDDCFCRGDDPTEASATNDGPYTVESYSTGMAQPSGVTSYTVWYPTDADPPFAGIAVVPGFLSPESSIRTWGPFLASHGIVAVTIGVPGGDQPNVRATKLVATVESLKGENTRSGSPLEGQLATDRMAVSGWSMGGGGTLIAAADNPDLRAAMSFAAWGPRGGGMNSVPVLMFEATADFLAAGMSDGYFRDVPDSVPKMLFEVQGSSHNVANSPSNHDGVIGRYGLSWLKVFLEGDERYRQFLTGSFPSVCTSKCDHNL